jgi:hypothetical protein
MRVEHVTGLAAPNIGMHPTRVSMDVIRQLEGLCNCVRAGDAGRYAAYPLTYNANTLPLLLTRPLWSVIRIISFVAADT